MERFAEKLFLVAALLCASIVLLIFVFMVILGLPVFTEGHVYQVLTSAWSPDHNQFGIFPMIIGSLSIATISLIIAFPISLGCSVFITVMNPGRPGIVIKKMIQLMTCIPTVIYGFTGIFLLVPIIRELFSKGSGMCLLSAGIMLAILISPTMILFFSDSFERVPKQYKNAVDALGGNSFQKFFHVILPCSWKGVLSGITLSFGRAIGDTLIALMIAGNSISTPDSVLDSARTLTAHIALIAAADFDSIEFRTIFICGITLYAFTITGISLVRFLGSQKGLNEHV